MKLNDLRPENGSVKSKKRIGRGHGSGLGKTSGRGHKGAGQRSGNKKRPWFEGGQMPLARRVPRRGFTNIFKEKFQIVNMSSLSNIKDIKDIKEIDSSVLFEKGLIRSPLKPVKILGHGKFSIKAKIVASAFSKNAIQKIEKAGGKAIVQ